MGVSEEIYQQLKHEILNLILIPGHKISENEISARFQSSRTPIRDVFTRLVGDGLLVVKPHVGTMVSKIDLNIVNDALYMREKLESTVLKELASTIDPMQKFKLSVLLMKQDNVLKQPLDEQEMAQQFHISDNQFHRTLFKLVQREHVLDYILNSFCDYERYRVFLNLTKKSDLQQLFYQHLELIDNLCVNNVPRMEYMIHDHLYGGLDKAVPLFMEHQDYFVGELKIK